MILLKGARKWVSGKIVVDLLQDGACFVLGFCWNDLLLSIIKYDVINVIIQFFLRFFDPP